jgi:hypothetical protein
LVKNGTVRLGEENCTVSLGEEILLDAIFVEMKYRDGR